MELYVKNEWKYRLYMSPYRSNSRDVMILIKLHLDIKWEE